MDWSVLNAWKKHCKPGQRLTIDLPDGVDTKSASRYVRLVMRKFGWRSRVRVFKLKTGGNMILVKVINRGSALSQLVREGKRLKNLKSANDPPTDSAGEPAAQR